MTGHFYLAGALGSGTVTTGGDAAKVFSGPSRFPVPVENQIRPVLLMQSAQDRPAQNAPGGLDSARYRRILVQS